MSGSQIGISTHVLDTGLGRPVSAIKVLLEQRIEHQWRLLAEHITDEDGRVRELLPDAFAFAPGTYRLCFKTSAWFTAQQLQSLYPAVEITFLVRDASVHHHIPLLIAANGFSTYRGS